MWQIRLFGKDDYADVDEDDTRNQWTPLFEVSGNELYHDVDSYTVKCKVRFRNGENVLIAYGETVMMFGYVVRARTVVAGAQYEFEIVEYMNTLTKYPVPRYGTTTFKQIENKTTATRSRIDNFSYPGGKKTLKEIMNTIMVGAGANWSHEIDDYYYGGNASKDIDGPYYRWNGSSIGTGYEYDRWYDIPRFTQVPGAYGQLPTAPNTDMVVNGRSIVQVLSSPTSDMWDQVFYVPWMADEGDTTPDASLAAFKKQLVHTFPTIELCAATVFATVKRILVDLCKMNVWSEVTYSGGVFPFEAVDGETIDSVRFILKYGYVRDHKVGSPLQYIQFRSDEQGDDAGIECVLVFGYDHSKDVGMAVKPGSSIPYKTAMWEYKDGRNEGELDSLAYQVLTDLQRAKTVVELDLKPGPALYEDEVIHVGDIIRVQCNDIVEYHKTNGWYDGSSGKYTSRMQALVGWGYLSAERNDNLYTVKAVRYSISKTTLELSDARKNIFDLMGDRLTRIEGTTQEYDIDTVAWKKADLSLMGRPAGELPYTNTDSSNPDYGNVKLISSKPSAATGAPTAFKTWNGIRWVDATEYTSDMNYPAYTQLLIMVKEENSMPEIPDSRGMVPLNYIGPWFNIEMKVLGSIPSMVNNHTGDMDYNNLCMGCGWTIPWMYDDNNAQAIQSSESVLQKLVDDGKYEFPDVKCRLPETWRKGIYFESETDCMVAPELMGSVGASKSVGCLNYVKIGPIPKGFDNVVINTSASFFDQVWADYSNDSASTLGGNIPSRGTTGKNCLTFNFQWCLGRDARPRSTAYNVATKANRQGYWDAGGNFIATSWDDDPDVIFDGKWNNNVLSPTWTSGYATQIATLHSSFSIAGKRLAGEVLDASLYLRYVIIFDTFRTNANYMYNFVALTGWTVNVTCTPGYELLLEWYKTRTHKIQMMVDGQGHWDKDEDSYKGPVSMIIDWPDEDYTNDEGYFCFDIRKFLGVGANYVRFRSVKEITSGVYASAIVDIRAAFISGWIKE